MLVPIVVDKLNINASADIVITRVNRQVHFLPIPMTFHRALVYSWIQGDTDAHGRADVSRQSFEEAGHCILAMSMRTIGVEFDYNVEMMIRMMMAVIEKTRSPKDVVSGLEATVRFDFVF